MFAILPISLNHASLLLRLDPSYLTSMMILMELSKKALVIIKPLKSMVKDAVLQKPILCQRLKEKNLTVFTDTQVNKILIDGNHAKGVECIGSANNSFYDQCFKGSHPLLGSIRISSNTFTFRE
jgi:phytoene dehydrogenase-like protein